MKKYKIGEIAELAGVSKRTIDYYTNLGLISPIPTQGKYRYYSDVTLFRLKIIEGLKKQRLTLGEIRDRLDLLEGNTPEKSVDGNTATVNISFIKEQLKKLEYQLSQLQSTDNTGNSAIITKQILLQSMTLVQSIILYINDLTTVI